MARLLRRFSTFGWWRPVSDFFACFRLIFQVLSEGEHRIELTAFFSQIQPRHSFFCRHTIHLLSRLAHIPIEHTNVVVYWLNHSHFQSELAISSLAALPVCRNTPSLTSSSSSLNSTLYLVWYLRSPCEGLLTRNFKFSRGLRLSVACLARRDYLRPLDRSVVRDDREQRAIVGISGWGALRTRRVGETQTHLIIKLIQVIPH